MNDELFKSYTLQDYIRMVGEAVSKALENKDSFIIFFGKEI
ncbi:hypothetical protein [Aquifex aeolicus]|nr:hypothetical protein [Aquifex aeolicus]